MASNAFKHWEQYLSAEDFLDLTDYIDNIRFGIPNDKMIILYGTGGNGKSTLMCEIESYLGDELCGQQECRFNELLFEENIKPLILLHDGTIDWTHKNYKSNRDLSNSIANLTRYGVSFIAPVNRIEIVNQKIINNSRIITMTHYFYH